MILVSLPLLLNLLINIVDGVVVNTEQGQVRGEILQAVTGDFEYVSFKGIPYAKPPVGNLRFMAPQPPESWNGVRNATQHGSVCIQLSIYNQVDISGSEDCLYLNVYTPNTKPAEPLAVMFFIHGGGFQSGSGNVDRYGPDYLITENVVIVTFNYRLGMSGFLSLNLKEVPGNAGLKDQVAAMKWVHKNIANFGGDPNKITIFGQSAGGVSVALHTLSPLTKGLFKRAVAMSGVPLNDWASPFEPRRLAFRFAQQLGLWPQDDRDLLKLLKSLPAEKLLEPKPAVLKSDVPLIKAMRSINTYVIERDFELQHFITMHPVQALTHGKIHDVELMLGHTTLETLINFVVNDTRFDQFANYTEMVVPRQILQNIPPVKMLSLGDKIYRKYFGDKQIDKNVAKEFVQYLSETYYNYGITKCAKLFSKYRKTFTYRFSKVTNFPRHINLDNDYGINASTHEDDLLYLFYPVDGNVTINKNSDDYKLVKTTCGLYANFAKYGNPTPDTALGVQWPPYNNVTGRYLDIDDTLTVRPHWNAEVFAFWDTIYKEAGIGV